jgi:hypothetical protein
MNTANVLLDKQRVLSMAVVRAATYLGLQERALADVLGLDMVTTSGLCSGDYLLSHDEREWELAVLLINVYDRLGVITGGSQADAVKWLNSPNYALQNCTPIELITTTDGLVNVVRYLGSMAVNYDLRDMVSRINCIIRSTLDTQSGSNWTVRPVLTGH